MRKTDLEKQLQGVESQIQELENRLPAHSVKPAMMMELLALEEKRDAILAQIQTMANQPPEK